MDRRRLIAVVAVLLATVVVLVLRNQPKVDENRRIRERRPAFVHPSSMLQPVALTNCQLERFGERHDGGYLMRRQPAGAARRELLESQSV